MIVYHSFLEKVDKTQITEGKYKDWFLFTLIFTIAEEGMESRKYSTSFVTSQMSCLFKKLYHVVRINCKEYEIVESGNLFTKHLILI